MEASCNRRIKTQGVNLSFISKPSARDRISTPLTIQILPTNSNVSLLTHCSSSQYFVEMIGNHRLTFVHKFNKFRHFSLINSFVQPSQHTICSEILTVYNFSFFVYQWQVSCKYTGETSVMNWEECGKVVTFSKTPEKGLPEGWIRATFILRKDHMNKLKPLV
jgi:hypothetical protein